MTGSKTIFPMSEHNAPGTIVDSGRLGILEIPSLPVVPPHTILALTLLYFPILNILVPHTGHAPWVAGLRFFMIMFLVFFISLLARHFMQYACICSPPFL
jgi:hypothetical protein